MNTDNRPPPYSMRLDPDLRAKLEAIAKANGRSLHAEISIRLEASLQKEEATSENDKSTYFFMELSDLKEQIKEFSAIKERFKELDDLSKWAKEVTKNFPKEITTKAGK